MTDTASEVDGRRLRRTQNREAVLDALVSLFAENVFDPSANDVAERAGISPRSLFRYFDDIDDLRQAAIEHVLAQAAPFLAHGIDPGEPLSVRIAGIVEARVRLFETAGPGARAARVNGHRNPATAARLRDTQALLRRQVRELFATELQGERAGVSPAVEVLCAFETYELLRSQQGLSRTKTIAAIVAALTVLLEGGRR